MPVVAALALLVGLSGGFALASQPAPSPGPQPSSSVVAVVSPASPSATVAQVIHTSAPVLEWPTPVDFPVAVPVASRPSGGITAMAAIKGATTALGIAEADVVSVDLVAENGLDDGANTGLRWVWRINLRNDARCGGPACDGPAVRHFAITTWSATDDPHSMAPSPGAIPMDFDTATVLIDYMTGRPLLVTTVRTYAGSAVAN
jgi:hypothetical protein